MVKGSLSYPVENWRSSRKEAGRDHLPEKELLACYYELGEVNFQRRTQLAEAEYEEICHHDRLITVHINIMRRQLIAPEIKLQINRMLPKFHNIMLWAYATNPSFRKQLWWLFMISFGQMARCEISIHS